MPSPAAEVKLTLTLQTVQDFPCTLAFLAPAVTPVAVFLQRASSDFHKSDAG